MKNSNFSIFHRYWMPNIPINASKKYSNGMAGSTIHKCRLIPDVSQNDSSNFYAMKVICYSKQQKKKSKKGLYVPTSNFVKMFQQIQTQYTVLQLLSKCHRVAKLKEIIHENPKRKDDQQFFYDFLQKPKEKDQRYICFVTQFCNEGTLDYQIQKNKKPFTKEEVVVYAAQILEGLFELKRKKILHRDLRLCNILLHNGEIRFSDFDTAFIGGVSTWKNVKNGIDIQTSPPQIIQLASKPDQDLMKYDSLELYQRQEKSDNYFFGLALFKMIFGYNYEKFNRSTLQNMVSQIISVSNHSPKLLELMTSCLEDRVDKRIDFFTLYTEFRQIQKQYYFKERIIDRVYLSEEPLCFASQKIFNNDLQILMKMKDSVQYLAITEQNEMPINFEEQLEKTANSRFTGLFNNFFQERSILELWKLAESEKKKEIEFKNNMETFIKTFSIRSHYYECLFQAILAIDIKKIKNKQFKKILKFSKKHLEQQLTIVLAFLFQIMFKCPFKRDKLYNNQNLPYEARKLFNNMIKCDNIQNKMHCYIGKSKTFCQNVSLVAEKIQKFRTQKYNDVTSFAQLYQKLSSLLNQIEITLNQILKDTIIKLRHAYKTLQNNETQSIREIMFILIVLQQQNLKYLRKNDLLLIWEQLTPFLLEEAELDEQEVQIFFNQYKLLFAEDQKNVNIQENIISVTMYAVPDLKEEDIEDDQEEIEKTKSLKINREFSDADSKSQNSISVLLKKQNKK